MHAIDPKEQFRLAEYDHLQQTLDLLQALHSVARNKPFFLDVSEEAADRRLRDPNSFYVENTTASGRKEKVSIWERENGRYVIEAGNKIG